MKVWVPDPDKLLYPDSQARLIIKVSPRIAKVVAQLLKGLSR